MSTHAHSALVLGGGKIGSLITNILASSEDYQVTLVDRDETTIEHLKNNTNLTNVTYLTLDVSSIEAIRQIATKHSFSAFISCLPYYCNMHVADVAVEQGIHYFDLTEDIRVMQHILNKNGDITSAMVPQCGLAPGFISIVTHALMKKFDLVDTVKMRVGALPVNPNNALKYSLTWSTDGLINEYGNTCFGIEQGKLTQLLPLEGYETINVDGLIYEAFNTSGGLGTLAHAYTNQVRTMNYKTLRYPGHCEKIRLLMNDLKLNDNRETLKNILENAIPKTKQDVVLIYVSVNGQRDGYFFEESYVKKIYPQRFKQQDWSAIQITTAAGMCGVVDIILNQPEAWHGFVHQHDIDLDNFLQNRFGKYYRDE